MTHAAARRARAKRAAAERLRRAGLREAGICYRCGGKGLPCAECNADDAQRMADRRASRVAAGGCAYCPTGVAMKGRRGCKACLNRAAIKSAAYRAAKKAAP